MGYLLDTDICSFHFRRSGGLAHRFIQYSGRLYVPTVVLAELYAGAYHLDDPTAIVEAIEELRRDLSVLPFDEACAQQFGQIRGKALKVGLSFATVDLMIASVALVHDLTLVTHNLADFQAVPGLHIEDWTT